MNIYKPFLRLYWGLISVIDKNRIASQTPDGGVCEVLDVPYRTGGQSAHMLDICYPESTSKSLPVIIDIHGGGWIYGGKEINRNFCKKLLHVFAVADPFAEQSGEVIRELAQFFRFYTANNSNKNTPDPIHS